MTETSYNPSAKFPSAYIERREMQYSYSDGDLYYFMDNETYEQVPINEKDLGDAFRFVKENEIVKVLSYKGSVFGIEAPNFVVLEVVETEPGVKGNSASTPAPASIWSAPELFGRPVELLPAGRRHSRRPFIISHNSGPGRPPAPQKEENTMDLNERAAYLKGLMDGLEIDEGKKEGKVLKAMYELLAQLCDTVTDLDADLDQAYDELDAMDEDMDELEEYVYGDDLEEDEEEDEEDEDAEVEYELTCPNCGAVTVVDEDTLLNEQVCCGNCGAEFEIEFTECDDEDCEGCAGCAGPESEDKE